MRPFVIVSGVLGGGSALVFVTAALVATLFPTGSLVPASPWGGGWVRAVPGFGGEDIVELPARDGGNVEWGPDGFQERRGGLDVDVARPGTGPEGF